MTIHTALMMLGYFGAAFAICLLAIIFFVSCCCSTDEFIDANNINDNKPNHKSSLAKVLIRIQSISG